MSDEKLAKRFGWWWRADRGQKQMRLSTDRDHIPESETSGNRLVPEGHQHLRVVRLSRIRLRRTERELDRTAADCASVSLNENAAQRGMSQYLPDAVRAG
jgi:hypothetical protein